MTTEKFFEKFPQKQFEKDKIIIGQEEQPEHIFYLEEGFVRQYIENVGGEELTVHIFQPGSLFPIILSLSGQENFFTFETVTATIVRVAPTKDVITWLKDNPENLFSLCSNLAGGLMGLSRRLKNTLCGSAYKSVASVIVYLADEFGTLQDDGSLLINPQFTHYHISTWLGLARETVSRQVEKLKDQGYVNYRGQTMFVYRIQELRDLC